eukprot:c21271_g1_i1.p1 GENE.c21271_g1_i1~~c21271_g1_i1.p1  ORF type:complete len:375 (+),score=80.01 c21271_g1_i1:477-1601(+)
MISTINTEYMQSKILKKVNFIRCRPDLKNCYQKYKFSPKNMTCINQSNTYPLLSLASSDNFIACVSTIYIISYKRINDSYCVDNIMECFGGGQIICCIKITNDWILSSLEDEDFEEKVKFVCLLKSGEIVVYVWKPTSSVFIQISTGVMIDLNKTKIQLLLYSELNKKIYGISANHQILVISSEKNKTLTSNIHETVGMISVGKMKSSCLLHPFFNKKNDSISQEIICIGDDKGLVRLIDTNSYKEISKWQSHDNTNRDYYSRVISSMSSYDGMLFTCAGNEIKIWKCNNETKLDEWICISSFFCASEIITSFFYFANCIICGTNSGNIRFFDTKDRKGFRSQNLCENESISIIKVELGKIIIVGSQLTTWVFE